MHATHEEEWSGELRVECVYYDGVAGTWDLPADPPEVEILAIYIRPEGYGEWIRTDLGKWSTRRLSLINVLEGKI